MTPYSNTKAHRIIINLNGTELSRDQSNNSKVPLMWEPAAEWDI